MCWVAARLVPWGLVVRAVALLVVILLVVVEFDLMTLDALLPGWVWDVLAFF